MKLFLQFLALIVFLFLTILFFAIAYYIFRSIYRFLINVIKKISLGEHYYDEHDNVELLPSREKWPYIKNRYLLTVSEKLFYNALRQILDNRVLIFPKVRLADIVAIPRMYKYNKTYWYKIQAKHIDFLICDINYLSPLMAIELDGSSHNSERAEKNDVFKNEVLEDVDMPFLRVDCLPHYDLDVLKKEIFDKLNMDF